jgi:glycosyltransferase involved in cell wall biosynthesis
VTAAPRVTHLATSPCDGAGTAVRREHEALISAGLPSRLLCARLDPARTTPAAEASPRPRETFAARLARKLLGWRSAQAVAEDRIASALRQSAEANLFELFSTPYSCLRPEAHPWVTEAEIVHLHWVASFVDYPRFLRSVRKPMVWTLHDQGLYLGGFHYEADAFSAPGLAGLEGEFREIKRRALAGSGCRMAVVGNSAWNTDRARASGFFPPGTQFETIYYPLDTDAFSPLDKAAAKRALGIDPGEFTVGFACTSLDNPRKGFDDLLRALALIEAAGTPQLGLLSFGRMPPSSAKAAIRTPWHQHGFVEDDAQKRTLYSAMDCFVIPSRAEAFGQTAIEAMACGTAVIGSRVGGIVEAVDGGRAGLLFPPGDSQAMAALMLRLLENPGEARALGAAGRIHVAERHAPTRCAAAHETLYRNLTGAGTLLPSR